MNISCYQLCQIFRVIDTACITDRLEQVLLELTDKGKRVAFIILLLTTWSRGRRVRARIIENMSSI